MDGKLMKTYTIDRFEKDLAVLLLRGNEREELLLNRHHLPQETKEGDLLEICFHPDGSVQDVKLLQEKTKEIKEKAKKLLEKLQQKHQ
jgi:hypothetical protein